MSNVVLVDYGLGNIRSIQRSLQKVGATVLLSANTEVISNADRLILPGVGAFEDGMKGLRVAGLLEAIRGFAATGNPMLGICLGMQMLLDRSEEYGIHQGLGLIPGAVRLIPRTAGDTVSRKIPHIGWSALRTVEGGGGWNGCCLSAANAGEFVYFVHSFMALPDAAEHVLAHCEYEGIKINAAIKFNNITGLQFHPEKSGVVGLRILRQFLSE